MDVVILGSGNVATHLGKALSHAGYNIVQVWSRNEVHAKELACRLGADHTNDLRQLNPTAHLYFVSVVDDVILTVLSQLKAGNRYRDDAMFIHTSGSTAIDVFNGLFNTYGVFYPLQTFSKVKEVDFKSIPVLIEASDFTALGIIRKLAYAISDRVEVVTSAQRKSLHIAAVFACNYTNYLYIIAQQLLEQNALDFDLIKPLIKETADKIQLHDPSEVQTGPAIRKDMAILEDHMKFLKANKEWQDIYKLLSDRLVALSTKK